MGKVASMGAWGSTEGVKGLIAGFGPPKLDPSIASVIAGQGASSFFTEASRPNLTIAIPKDSGSPVPPLPSSKDSEGGFKTPKGEEEALFDDIDKEGEGPVTDDELDGKKAVGTPENMGWVPWLKSFVWSSGKDSGNSITAVAGDVTPAEWSDSGE